MRITGLSSSLGDFFHIYALMSLALLALPVQQINENVKLMFTILFSIVMMLAVIFFFTLYFLWLDSLSGYTQGLRSAFLNFQPVLLDFPTAFYFSFSCYFSLGFGAYYPYGHWFYLLVPTSVPCRMAEAIIPKTEQRCRLQQ